MLRFTWGAFGIWGDFPDMGNQMENETETIFGITRGLLPPMMENQNEKWNIKCRLGFYRQIKGFKFPKLGIRFWEVL